MGATIQRVRSPSRSPRSVVTPHLARHARSSLDWRWLAVTIGTAALSVGVVAEARAASTPTPEEAVSQLNAWRALVGVAPVAFDATNTEGCRLHANYHGRNPTTFGHSEDPRLEGYTAEGNAAASSSALATGQGSPDGPWQWAGAVFHRTSLLNPDLTRSGFWSEFDLSCMGTFEQERRPSTELSVHPYPYRGQTGVPTSFDCRETPNPCDWLPAAYRSGPVGFIPSAQFNGPWSRAGVPTLSSATLTPDGGSPVDMTALDATSSAREWLDGGVAFVPHQPLLSGVWYTLRAAGTIPVTGASGRATEPISLATRFRTGNPFVDARPGLRFLREQRRRVVLGLRLPAAMVGGSVRVAVLGGKAMTRTFPVTEPDLRIVVPRPKYSRRLRVEPILPATAPPGVDFGLGTLSVRLRRVT